MYNPFCIFNQLILSFGQQVQIIKLLKLKQ